VEYGYTLALGAAEVTMLDLANAYAHLSTTQPAVINPILEIRSRDGSLIYQKTPVQQPEVIKPGIAYLIWKILSDPANRLPGWVTKFNINGLTMALKTGTSNMKTDKGNNLPRDGWLATYNPSKVAVFWAGNAD
jgi:membrane peptidoglycan carboxypeptidase